MRWYQVQREYQKRFEIAFQELWEQFAPLPGLTDAEKAARVQAMLKEAREAANTSVRDYQNLIREIARNWVELAMDKGIIPQQRHLPRQLSISALEQLRDVLAESPNAKERVKAQDVERAIQAQKEATFAGSISSTLRGTIRMYTTPEGLHTEALISHTPLILAEMASIIGYTIPLAKQVYGDYLDPTRAERRVAPQFPENPKEKVWEIAFKSKERRGFRPSYYKALEEAFQYVDEHGPVKHEEVQRIKEINQAARTNDAVGANNATAITTFAKKEGLIPQNYGQFSGGSRKNFDTFYNRLADQNPRDPRLSVLELARAANMKGWHAMAVYKLAKLGNVFFEKMRGLATDETTVHYIEVARMFFADAQAEKTWAARTDAANALRDFKIAANRFNPIHFPGTEEASPLVEGDLPPPEEPLPPVTGRGVFPAPVLLPRVTAASVQPFFEPASTQLALPAPPKLRQLSGPANPILSPISGGAPLVGEFGNPGSILELEKVGNTWQLPLRTAEYKSPTSPPPQANSGVPDIWKPPRIVISSYPFEETVGFGTRVIRWGAKWVGPVGKVFAVVGATINSVAGAIALHESYETRTPVPIADFIATQSFHIHQAQYYVHKLEENYQDPLIARSRYYDEKWRQYQEGGVKFLEDEQRVLAARRTREIAAQKALADLLASSLSQKLTPQDFSGALVAVAEKDYGNPRYFGNDQTRAIPYGDWVKTFSPQLASKVLTPENYFLPVGSALERQLPTLSGVNLSQKPMDLSPFLKKQPLGMRDILLYNVTSSF